MVGGAFFQSYSVVSFGISLFSFSFSFVFPLFLFEISMRRDMLP